MQTSSPSSSRIEEESQLYLSDYCDYKEQLKSKADSD
jgi:hypothetical protein